MKFLKNLFRCLVLIGNGLFLTSCAVKNPPTTVDNVNLNKYMGKWYEIASFPNSFQKNCKCTNANYEFVGNKVKVVNKCRRKSVSAKWDIATGHAKVVPNTGNSKLKVTFFWPFYGDYWILYLTKNYSEVLVGNPSRKYLWILSREKSISKKDYDFLVNIAKEKGFDVSKLKKTTQC